MKRRINFFYYEPGLHQAQSPNPSVCALELMLAIKGVKARGFAGETGEELAMNWDMRQKKKEYDNSLIGACDMVLVWGDDPDVGKEVIAEARKYGVPVFRIQQTSDVLNDSSFGECVGLCRSILSDLEAAKATA